MASYMFRYYGNISDQCMANCPNSVLQYINYTCTPANVLSEQTLDSSDVYVASWCLCS